MAQEKKRDHAPVPVATKQPEPAQSASKSRPFKLCPRCNEREMQVESTQIRRPEGIDQIHRYCRCAKCGCRHCFTEPLAT